MILALIVGEVISVLVWSSVWITCGPAAVLIPLCAGALGMVAIGLWMHKQ
jgi:hypothetical protein